MARSVEARKVLRGLEKERKAASQEHGQPVVWTAAEEALIALISAEIDRKSELEHEYEVCSDAKVRIRLSAEIRLVTHGVARLLRQVNPEPPKATESLRTLKARRAAQARWRRSS